MSDPIRITFHNDPDAILEAMVTAGRSVLGTDARLILLQLARVILICFGGTAIVATFAVYQDRLDSLGPIPLLIAAAAAAALGWFSDTWPYRLMARRIAKGPMESGEQQMIATDEALTFMSKLNVWRTDWPAITFLKAGKTGLLIGVSGVAFAIPRDAFKDDADLAQVLARLQALKDAAT